MTTTDYIVNPDDGLCSCCGDPDCEPCELCGGCTTCLNCSGPPGDSGNYELCLRCSGEEPVTADDLMRLASMLRSQTPMMFTEGDPQ